jgi:hypothetical protein
MTYTACHLKEHFIGYRMVPNMLIFVHLTGVASFGEKCLKAPFSSFIFSAL